MNQPEAGFLAVFKEAGYTSHDVVAKLRRILGTRRVGHAGTLDPEATGVLPVAFGKATRFVELAAEGTKTYEASLRLGVVTDTQDMTGTVLARSDALPSEEEIRLVCTEFLGKHLQTPPMYSAIKVNGVRLYELARQGKTVERVSRPVEILSLSVDNVQLPLVRLTITCSKGTYIRTLCHDIGSRLGCGGAMETLQRTRVGSFRIEECHTLSQLETAAGRDRLAEMVLPVEDFLSDAPRVDCLPAGDKLLINGNSLTEGDVAGFSRKAEKVKMYTSDGRFLGLYGWEAERRAYVPLRMYL